MELRNGTVVGGALPPQGRALFEEGVSLVFTKWTALNLAVEGEWGGLHSRDKALQFMQHIAQWFYRRKEHYEDELEEELAQCMLDEFNAELEDGSPLEVAKALLALHAEALRGETATLARVRAMPTGASTSQRQASRSDDEDDASSSDDEDGSSMDADGGAAAAVPTPAAVPLQQQQQVRPPPVVDEDGFETVTRRRGRR